MCVCARTATEVRAKAGCPIYTASLIQLGFLPSDSGRLAWLAGLSAASWRLGRALV